MESHQFFNSWYFQTSFAPAGYLNSHCLSMYVIWWQNIKSLHFAMYVLLPGDVGVLLFLDRKNKPHHESWDKLVMRSQNPMLIDVLLQIKDLGSESKIMHHQGLSTQIPLTSRTSYIKNVIKKPSVSLKWYTLFLIEFLMLWLLLNPTCFD